MVSHFDPMIGADRPVAYSRVTLPVIQSGLTFRGPENARHTMQTWEQQIAEIVMKYAMKVDEDAKISAPLLIVPDTLFGEACVSGGIRTCAQPSSVQ